MANKQRYHVGELVIINTGGADTRGKIEYDQPPIPALKGCYLIKFDSGGPSQWMGAEHLRPMPPENLDDRDLCTSGPWDRQDQEDEEADRDHQDGRPRDVE